MHLRRIRSWLIVGALLCGACGGSSDSADPAAAFAGTWVFKDGAVVPSCTGITVAGQTDLTGNTTTITRTDAHHIALAISNAELTCSINLTVSGSTATTEASQSCSISLMGTTVPVAISSWTMALSGSSISMSMSGTASVFIVSCTAAGMGTLVQP